MTRVPKPDPAGLPGEGAQGDPGVGGARQAVAAHRQIMVGAEERIETTCFRLLGHRQQALVVAPCCGSTKIRTFIRRDPNGSGHTTGMEIGVIFPQTELGGDRGAVAPMGMPPRPWATPTWRPTTTCWAVTPPSWAISVAPMTSTPRSTSPAALRLPGRASPTSTSPPPSSSGPNARPPSWPSRRPSSTCSRGGQFRLGLGIGWNRSSTRPSGSPSPTGGRSSMSRSRCCASSGRRRA